MSDETCSRCFSRPGRRELTGPPLCDACRPIVRAEHAAIDARRPSRAADTRRRYGIDPEGVAALLHAQGGRCALCACKLRRGPAGHPAGKPACIDHCHETGRVRGLLCARCNTRIVPFERDRSWLVRVLDYLDPERGTTILR